MTGVTLELSSAINPTAQGGNPLQRIRSFGNPKMKNPTLQSNSGWGV